MEQSQYKTIAVVAIAVILVAALAWVFVVDSEDEWELQASSDAAMMAALGSAMDDEEHIVVTLWIPHWAFAEYDNLVFLEDPENIYGDAEEIQTIANDGWKKDNPDAYDIAANFNWTAEEIGEVMDLQNEHGEAEGAQKWIDANNATVDAWINGTSGTGTIEVGLVDWACAQASTNVMKLVLEEAGFNVEVTTSDAGPMYADLADDGGLDVTFTAWMPLTHESYWDSEGDDLEVVGTSLEGAKTGLVVPQYTADELGLTTIADLKDNGEHFDWKITGIDAGAGIMSATEDALEEYLISQDADEGY